MMLTHGELATKDGKRFRIIRELCVKSTYNGNLRNFLLYVASEPSTADGRPVVIKFPNPDKTHQPAIRHSFQREMGVFSSLPAHANIVRCIEQGDLALANETPYIVLEFIEGETLKDINQDKGLPLTFYQVMAIIEQIIAGLELLHSLNVLHCDLKPSNIMLDYANKRVVLIDFGSAWMPQWRYLTPPGTTSLYMAPEQAVNHLSNQRDVSTDLHALAAVIYELATGTSCFGPNRSLEMIHSERADALPPPIHVMQAKLEPCAGTSSAALAKVLTECLNVDRTARPYKRARDLMTALLAIASSYTSAREGSGT